MIATPSRRLHVSVALALLIWPLALWAYAHGRPPWGDEAHFLAAVRFFADGISVEKLRTYPELATPLTFVLYAAWGQLAGFDLAALRLLTPVLAWATSLLFWRALARAADASASWALLALATIVFNPYFTGLSIFVFTDMPALLGLSITTLGVLSGRAAMTAAGIAVATMSRQYLAFLAPAVMVTAWLTATGAARWRMIAAAAIGLLPLAAMVWLWGGVLAPMNGLRSVYLSMPAYFEPRFLSLYLAAPGIYLLPLLAPTLPRDRTIWLAAAGIAVFVLIFPVTPSSHQLANTGGTVGFVHERLSARLPAPALAVVFWAAATIWIAAAINALARTRPWERPRRSAMAVFPWVGCLLFLVLMPFSYMPWEKYALPLLMLGSVGIVVSRARRDGYLTAS